MKSFRLKSLLHSLLSKWQPLYSLWNTLNGKFGNQLPYFNSDLLNIWETHDKYLKIHKAHSIIEVGGGKTLAQNLYLSSRSRSFVVVDVARMAKISSIQEAQRKICEIKRVQLDEISDFDQLKIQYGIEYLAPFDPKDTEFLSGSFDATISTNTFEHIPSEEIPLVLNELLRILRPGGVFLARIDYSDHYSHSDPDISNLNFLQFTETEWTKFNHKTHYQNRLRHQDYIRLFCEAGFRIQYETCTAAPLETINGLMVSDYFDTSDRRTFATDGYFVLQSPTEKVNS